MSLHKRHSNLGFTLVELMISMILGTVLIAIAMTAFQAGAHSTRFSESIAAIQSNARFALGELTAGVRSAGYTGCSSPLKQRPLIPSRVSSSAILQADLQSLVGFEVRSTDWLPTMPQGYTNADSAGYTPVTSGRAKPISGSSAIVLEGAIGRGTGLSTPNYASNTIQLTDLSSGFSPGSMAIISTCSQSEAFHILSASSTLAAGVIITTVAAVNDTYAINADYELDTRVIPYRRALYFIGETGRFTNASQPIRALFEHAYPYVDRTPVELAEGVDAMVIRYRMLDEDGNTNEVSANDASFDADLVVSVRIGLLFSTDTRKESSDDNVSFQIAGVNVVPVEGDTEQTVPSYPNDDRVRLVFEQTAKIRNRNVGNRFQ